MITCKAWRGDDLRGEWQVLRKLDGVRALRRGSKFVSRHGKRLHNLGMKHHRKDLTDCEVWLGDFKRTIQAVRTSTATIYIPSSACYQLDPPDPRLILRWVKDPTAATIRALLKRYKRRGEDGLVLRQGDRWLKVKHVATYDVKVIDVKPGKGRHKGKRIGALLTSMGRVGTGLSDALRRRFYLRVLKADRIIGKTIEVACSQLTPGGKFRHARFVRVREDR